MTTAAAGETSPGEHAARQSRAMAELLHRMIDIVLIVLGAFGALHLNLHLDDAGPAHQIDLTLVAFVAALALSVFPACGTYPARGSRSVMSIASRTTFAWLAVQICAYALLYAIHRDHLLSIPWFIYWTLTTGVSLLAAHTLFFAQWSVARQAGAWLRGESRPVAPAEARLQSCVMRRGLKRVFDVVAGLILIALLSPVLGLVALAVKRDGGPALYGHARVGRNGRKFRCLKFRSMVVNSDEVLKALLAADPAARAEWEREFKLKNDVRVTRLGHFLRRTSLDELPQLWNVVRGEMSLVGPRPIVDAELERYGANSKYYLMATPGITGLWQVSGRCDTDYATRVSLDVKYVMNWSLLRDIAILLKTVVVVVRGHGAY